MKKIEIFTDGCCKGNPGPGGYGCIIVSDGKTRELSGASRHTTNNIMELMGAVVALRELGEPCEVELTSDSQYLVKGMTEWVAGWVRKEWLTADRKPVKNRELWEELYRLSRKHKISWKWVRGHTGHPENERCDLLANQALAQL